MSAKKANRTGFNSSEQENTMTALKKLSSIYKKENGSKPQYHIITYGCQMNVNDSEKMAGILDDAGYQSTQSKDDAQIIMFNTCCVRDHAEQRVFGNVGALAKWKRKGEKLLGICGCMTQQDGMSKRIAKIFPHVDFIIGTHQLIDLPHIILESLSSSKPVIKTAEGLEVIEGSPIRRDKSHSAWISIMYGCDNYCSYCIVPYVRGRERSRRMEDILNEAKQLIKEGCIEINLLGQNVNSYRDGDGKENMFPTLLRELDKLEGVERIRFMTSHPKDLSDSLIDAMAKCDKVCDHLHLPVQSGSDIILKAMNRRYTSDYYYDLINKIKEKIPDIAFSTDIIVGFPGETDENFNDTLSLVEKVGFDSAFCFKYSERTGTPAAVMTDQIDDDIKKERLAKLLALQTETGKAKNKQYEGKVFEVLVNNIHQRDEGMCQGRTKTNKLVSFKGNYKLVGKLIKVKITKAEAHSLRGEIV